MQWRAKLEPTTQVCLNLMPRGGLVWVTILTPLAKDGMYALNQERDAPVVCAKACLDPGADLLFGEGLPRINPHPPVFQHQRHFS
jgi:hypothetical protein